MLTVVVSELVAIQLARALLYTKPDQRENIFQAEHM